MSVPFWVVLNGHESGCPCFGCVFLNAQMTSEAVASVALDRDPRGQTISLDEWNLGNARTSDNRQEDDGDSPDQA